MTLYLLLLRQSLTKSGVMLAVNTGVLLSLPLHDLPSTGIIGMTVLHLSTEVMGIKFGRLHKQRFYLTG